MMIADRLRPPVPHKCDRCHQDLKGKGDPDETEVDEDLARRAETVPDTGDDDDEDDDDDGGSMEEEDDEEGKEEDGAEIEEWVRARSAQYPDLHKRPGRPCQCVG